MKYTIFGFQQKRLTELKLDVIDAGLLRWFIDFKDAGDMKIIVRDGLTWYWILYKNIIKDMPILGIKNNESLARRFNKLVEAEILFKHIEKKKGTYTYFRLNPDEYIKLIKHPTQKSSVIETPDSKVEPNKDSTQKSGTTRLKSRTKDPSTNDSYLSLIVKNPEIELNFNQVFNDFCIRNDDDYRKDTLYWITHNAAKYNNSIEDVISALSICNEKEKQGNMAYLTGILREKRKQRKDGIKPMGKPEYIQVLEYLKKRLMPHGEFLKSFEYIQESGEVDCTIFNQEDKDVIDDLLNQLIAIDVQNHLGVNLFFRIR